MLAVAGFATSAVGAGGLLLAPGAAPVDPVAASPPAAASPAPQAPASPAARAAFGEALDDPVGDVAGCADGSAGDGGPAHLDVVGVRVRQTENPATGEPSTALLLDLADASPSPDVRFHASVLVEPPEGLPDDVDAMDWRLVYADGRFEREARELRGDEVRPVGTDDFRVRYEGFGDRVEIEFYGPVGTLYRAALVGDGQRCDSVLPDR